MCDYPIDIVIPYVNNEDEEWQKEYEKYKDIQSDALQGNTEVRYRDWGTLKYLFRSIEQYIPWINKVFLILSGPTQIPNWLDTNNPKLQIVYHKEYIPKRLLPTFNANTIECFLYKISELSEHFIYGNDDVFFNKPLYPDDFFVKDKIVLNLTKKTNTKNGMYDKQWHNCAYFGMSEHNKYEKNVYYATDHTFAPMRKSTLQHLFDYWGDELINTFTPIRKSCNVNQHLPHHYELSIDNVLSCRIKNNYQFVNNLSFNIKDFDTFVLNDNICDFIKRKSEIKQFMDLNYPIRSSFEKEKVNQDNLISIIVPIYNLQDYIIYTLDSIKNQTYSNFECLIINDGSIDNTENVVKEYCNNDSRFKYFYKENGGVSSARNYGISLARGKYLCFLDGDDISPKLRFEVCADYLNNNPNENIIAGLQIKFKNDKIIYNKYHSFGYFSIDDLGFIGKSNFCNINSLFFKTDFIKSFKFVDTPIGEDVIFILDLIIKNKRIPTLNYVCYHYLTRENSAIQFAVKNKLSEEKQYKIIQAYNDLINRYKKESESIKNLISRYLCLHLPWLRSSFDTYLQDYNKLIKSVNSQSSDKIDVVITYVNSNDRIWKLQLAKYTNTYNKNRYRDYGTLKYLLRLIEKNMSFVNNVFLVVSSESQIPNWVNKETVKVITHNMIIPKEFLPTFNSCTIEMFLQNIPGLSEKYIYFNDDMFPVKELNEFDFFEKDKIKLKLQSRQSDNSMFRQQCKNSTLLAIPDSKCFYMFAHTITPMLKNENIEFYKSHKKEINASLTKFRNECNLNQYVFLNNLIAQDKVIDYNIDAKYFEIQLDKLEAIKIRLQNPNCHIMCLNDGMKIDNDYVKKILVKSFEKVVPEKSIYEI